MKFHYNLFYDKDKDEFYANVESIDDSIVYEIDDTKEMVMLIDAGYMDHIDDLVGLKSYLLHEGTLAANDELLMGGFYQS